ncbi:MAG: hypothetical protein E7411_01290 [Ruminococcaceae bacterium]|nr:hypothetical protein [Oscillospiraceae bacterium]
MFKESIFGRFIFAVLRLLKTFEFSAAYRILSGIKNAFVRIFKGSVIYRFFYREDKIGLFTEKSAILKWADKIIITVITFFLNIYKSIKKVNTGSINNGIYNRLNSKGCLSFKNILGIAIILMVCVPGSKWNNMYALLLATALTGLYFLSLLSGNRLSHRVSKFDIIMLVFMFASFLGIFISLAPSDSIRIFMFFITAFMFMLLVSGSIKKTGDLQSFTGFISVGLILTSLYCIYQGIVGVEIDVRLTDIATNQGMPGRAYSTFENPNNYAEYLVMFIPFMAAYALNKKDKKQKLLWFFMLLIPLVALVYTYSRSCWVSLLIAAVVFIAFYNYKLLPLLAIVGICMLPFLPETVMNRILTIGSMKDTSNKYRLVIWEGVLKMLKDTWVMGIGLGPKAFSLLYPSYADPSAILAPHSHMLFMEVLVELGIIGFASFMLYWVITLKRLITTKIRRSISNEQKNYICASLASLSGMIFVSGVEYIWFYPRTMFVFFIMLGLIKATLNITKKERLKD